MLVNTDMQISAGIAGTLDALAYRAMSCKTALCSDASRAAHARPTITVQEMNEYGYKWDGMLPLQESRRRLFEAGGVGICIYEDNTEAQF